MTTADAVFRCALFLLARPVSSLPPVEFVDQPPAGVSRNAEAYLHRGPDVIVLVTSSGAFRDAATAVRPCRATSAMVKVASLLVHEEAHLRDGASEQRAYDLQLRALFRLGVRPDSSTYIGVQRSQQSLPLERGRLAARGASDPGSGGRPTATPPRQKGG